MKSIWMLAVQAFLLRSKSECCIDGGIIKQLESTRQYWRDVLKRVVVVVKLLASRGLALRGRDEILGSPHIGNFLGVLEAISEFDPFLAQHLAKYGNQGRGNVSYIFHPQYVMNLWFLLLTKILSEIVAQIKTAKYYSVSVDSTPDVSHCDQLTVIPWSVLSNSFP